MISYKEERNLLHLIVLPESNIILSHRPVIPSPSYPITHLAAPTWRRSDVHPPWSWFMVYIALPFEFCFCFCAECTIHVVVICNAMTSITDVTGHHVTSVTSDVLVVYIALPDLKSPASEDLVSWAEKDQYRCRRHLHD